MFQIFVVLFAKPRCQQNPSKKTLKTVSKQWNPRFLYLAGQRYVFWQSVELNSPLNKSTPPKSGSASVPKVKIKNNLSNSPAPSKPSVGFFNKGSTCYANTIVQALSVIPLLWKTSFAESAQLSPY